MEEKLRERNSTFDEDREVGLGICFGSGVGILVGAVAGNVGFGLSAGGVLGILVACGIRAYLRFNSK